MPTLTVAGHSVTVGDEFLKLSPEEQNNTVEEIAKSLPAEGHSSAAEKPSGFVAGLSKGIANETGGLASTLGLTGIKSDGLDKVTNATTPANYKAASLIREGGHWYNPTDYQPSALPQMLAEQAPGLIADLGAGKIGATVGGRAGGARGAMIGGTGAALASMIARGFGPGAHENAAARTGDINAEVSGSDIAREAGKQVLTAPLNAIGLSKIIPGLGGKVAGVGLDGAGSALKKYLSTVGTEAATGGASDAVNQAATNVGQEHGKPFDANEAATAGITRGAGGALLVAPRLAGEVHAATKFSEFGGANAEAATALANRQRAASVLKRITPDAVDAAHADVHTELKDAAKNETGLSTDNNNTLKRIQSGGTATPADLKNLATEADPETVHLARQALLSSQIKDMGVGGISGAMDKLGPIARPANYIGGAVLGTGIPGIGHLAIPALAGVYGAYGVARAFDKLTGARRPAQGFTDKFADKFADANVPVRTPEAVPAEPAPVTTSVPQVAPPQDTALWGAPKPAGPSLSAQNADIQGMLRMAAARRNVIAQQAPVTADVPAQAPAISPIALKMLQQKIKQGLPEEAPAPTAPVAEPTPAPPLDAFDALKPLLGRQRALMRGLNASSKQQVADNAAQRKAAGIAQAEGLSADSPAINDHGGLAELSNPEFTKRGSQLLSAASVMRRLTAQPADEAGAVSDAPASPAISALMQKLQGQSVGPSPAPAPAEATALPEPPMIAKINKKLNGKVKETPHPEEDQPYTPIAPEDQWRNGLSHDDVARMEADRTTNLHPLKRGAFESAVSNKREEIYTGLERAAMQNEASDAPIMKELAKQLDHQSGVETAQRAVRHYAAHMSPKGSVAVHKIFSAKRLAQLYYRKPRD